MYYLGLVYVTWMVPDVCGMWYDIWRVDCGVCLYAVCKVIGHVCMVYVFGVGMYVLCVRCVGCVYYICHCVMCGMY